MNSVLVPLNDVKGHRGPQPRGAEKAGRETSVPRPAERPFAETRNPLDHLLLLPLLLACARVLC